MDLKYLNFKIKTPNAVMSLRIEMALKAIGIEVNLLDGDINLYYGIAVNGKLLNTFESPILYAANWAVEITMTELEELAANLGNWPYNSSNVISKSLTELKEKIALAKENKTFEGVTDGDQFLFEATAITESPDKAKERYEAAILYLECESERWYDSDDKSFYPEDSILIKQALKIAAGIPE